MTDPERRAVIMTVRARMRDESGTFHELLRRALEKLEVTEPRPEPRSRFIERAVKRIEDQNL